MQLAANCEHLWKRMQLGHVHLQSNRGSQQNNAQERKRDRDQADAGSGQRKWHNSGGGGGRGRRQDDGSDWAPRGRGRHSFGRGRSGGRGRSHGRYTGNTDGSRVWPADAQKDTGLPDLAAVQAEAKYHAVVGRDGKLYPNGAWMKLYAPHNKHNNLCLKCGNKYDFARQQVLLHLSTWRLGYKTVCQSFLGKS